MASNCNAETTPLNDEFIIERLKKLEEESNEKPRYYTVIDREVIGDHPLKGVFFFCKTKFGALLTLYKYMISNDIPCYYGPKRNKVPQSICDLLASYDISHDMPCYYPSISKDMVEEIECFTDESFDTFPKIIVASPNYSYLYVL